MRYYYLVILAITYLAYVNSEACVQCNSATDSKCATSPEQYMAKDCANATARCYTRVQDGNTIRGCTSELDSQSLARCNNEMECITCLYIEGCNRFVFPNHRATCIQCEGNTTGSCALDTFARATVCPLYKLGDKCFIRNNGRNETKSLERGCLSSAHARKLCVKDGNCYTCEGSGCNNLDAKSEQIPMARDSVAAFGYSLTLLLAGFMVARHF